MRLFTAWLLGISVLLFCPSYSDLEAQSTEFQTRGRKAKKALRRAKAAIRGYHESLRVRLNDHYLDTYEKVRKDARVRTIPGDLKVGLSHAKQALNVADEDLEEEQKILLQLVTQQEMIGPIISLHDVFLRMIPQLGGQACLADQAGFDFEQDRCLNQTGDFLARRSAVGKSVDELKRGISDIRVGQIRLMQRDIRILKNELATVATGRNPDFNEYGKDVFLEEFIQRMENFNTTVNELSPFLDGRTLDGVVDAPEYPCTQPGDFGPLRNFVEHIAQIRTLANNAEEFGKFLNDPEAADFNEYMEIFNGKNGEPGVISGMRYCGTTFVDTQLRFWRGRLDDANDLEEQTAIFIIIQDWEDRKARYLALADVQEMVRDRINGFRTVASAVNGPDNEEFAWRDAINEHADNLLAMIPGQNIMLMALRELNEIVVEKVKELEGLEGDAFNNAVHAAVNALEILTDESGSGFPELNQEVESLDASDGALTLLGDNISSGETGLIEAFLTYELAVDLHFVNATETQTELPALITSAEGDVTDARQKLDTANSFVLQIQDHLESYDILKAQLDDKLDLFRRAVVVPKKPNPMISLASDNFFRNLPRSGKGSKNYKKLERFAKNKAILEVKSTTDSSRSSIIRTRRRKKGPKWEQTFNKRLSVLSVDAEIDKASESDAGSYLGGDTMTENVGDINRFHREILSLDDILE